MATKTDILPLTETASPATQAELAEAVRAAFEARTPVYPLGGQTALDYGLPARHTGLGLSLAQLDRVVDYPARDMTVTVEAGITIAALAELLGSEGQWLPVDVPQPERATLGGVIATNASGPRRFGQGTIRDYVIGITAVDGRGVTFHGGGRVVKNVAGYDFCKLLTGSLGTLGVISQVTLKVRPLAKATALAACDLAPLDEAERLLAALVNSQTTPAAIELLIGPAWREDPQSPLSPVSEVIDAAKLVVGLEGSKAEVDWMVDRLQNEWRELGVAASHVARDEQALPWWRKMIEFPADLGSIASIRASVLPGCVVQFCREMLAIDPQASIQAHAGSGIVHARFASLTPQEVAGVVIKRLQPLAVGLGGGLILTGAASGVEITRQLVWGPARGGQRIMNAVKQQFDPRGILNPGRFVFP